MSVIILCNTYIMYVYNNIHISDIIIIIISGSSRGSSGSGTANRAERLQPLCHRYGSVHSWQIQCQYHSVSKNDIGDGSGRGQDRPKRGRRRTNDISDYCRASGVVPCSRCARTGKRIINIISHTQACVYYYVTILII